MIPSRVVKRIPQLKGTEFLPNYAQPYDALFEQTNDAVVILDSEGNYVAANQRATEMLGYPPEELVGSHMSMVVLADEYDDSQGRMEALLAGENVPIYERTLVRKDGSHVPVEINASLVRDEHGRVAYFQSVARDISERKAEEEALRRIAEGTAGPNDDRFFDALAGHLAEMLDVHCAIVTERRDMDHAHVLGWSQQEIPAKEHAYLIKGTPTELVYQGQVLYQPGDVQKIYPNDVHIGSLDAHSYYGLPLRDSDSQIVGHLAIIDDKPMSDELRRRSVLRIFAARAAAEITRRRADRRRQDSETRYQTLVEQLPAITYTASLSEQTPALYISPQIEQVLGFTVPEFSVRPSRWRQQLHPDDRGSVIEALERTVRDHRPFREEYRIFRKDGSLAWVRDEARVVFDSEGIPLLLQGIMVDITVEKRLTEELLNARKLESVGMLAGGIAHDFNNTLMGILGNLAIAKNRLEEDHSAHTRLVEAEKAALRAKGLTQQLLTFSKGGAPVRRMTSIEGVLRDTVQFALSGSNVEGTVEVSPDLWAADIDEGQISQVIENLALNAAQAMPTGGNVRIVAENVELGARSGVPVRPGRFVRIRVIDDGPGIDGELIDRIFDPYFTTKKDGNGLGLATSYAIVQKHEGHLGVRSEVGRGSEFAIYLPAGELEAHTDDESAPATSARAGHILVMDDDELVLDAVGTMLHGFGHRAQFARSGEEAVSLYRQAMEAGDRFDLALLDLTIRGGFGGEEAMKKILATDPSAVGVVSSGYSDSPVMSDATRYGFRDHLAKPYQPSELERLLAKLLPK